LVLLVCLLLAEPLTHLAHRVVAGSWFPRDEYLLAMQGVVDQCSLLFGERVKDGERGLGKAAVQVIHPYLGYVHDHGLEPLTSEHGFPLAAGFSSPGALVEPDRQGRVEPMRVAVLGGSFAAGLATVAGEDLARELEAPGRPVEVVNLAMGGYKQPQQLLALAYMLSLGEQYSVVLNIDGFNEVVLPSAHNRAAGLNPFFPLRWPARVANVRPTKLVKSLARVELVDRARDRWARLFTQTGLHRSAVLCVVWRARDSWLHHRRQRLAAESEAAIARSGSQFAAVGPSYDWPRDETAAVEQLADHWLRCSRQMSVLCKASGSLYVHVLQPNQYVEGSKPMGAEERRVAFNEGHPYRPGVIAGYPLLRERGRLLLDEGVRFLDCTKAFEDIHYQVYVDDCCHVNHYGYRQLIALIGRAVRKEQAPLETGGDQ
jgi:hypothetical protein